MDREGKIVDTAFMVMALLVVVAMASGLLTWISKNVWRSRTRTGLFAVMGIGSTIGFVVMAMAVIP
jgi:ABC-type uncharacterized transport system YnjBCD permease subunit